MCLVADARAVGGHVGVDVDAGVDADAVGVVCSFAPSTCVGPISRSGSDRLGYCCRFYITRLDVLKWPS